MKKIEPTPEMIKLAEEISGIRAALTEKQGEHERLRKAQWEELGEQLDVTDPADYAELTGHVMSMNVYASEILEKKLKEFINPKAFYFNGTWTTHVLEDGTLLPFINFSISQSAVNNGLLEMSSFKEEFLKVMSLIPEAYHSLPIVELGVHNEFQSVYLMKNSDDGWSIGDRYQLLKTGSIDEMLEQAREYSY